MVYILMQFDMKRLQYYYWYFVGYLSTIFIDQVMHFCNIVNLILHLDAKQNRFILSLMCNSFTKKNFKSYCDSVCLPLLSLGDVQLAGSMFWPIILRYIVKNFHVIKIGKKAEHGLRNEWQNMNGCEVQELLINRCISWRWESERQYSHCTRWHRLPQWVSTGPPTWWVPRWERRRSLQLQEPWHEYCSQHTDSLWTVLNLFSFFRNWISAFSWRKFLSCSLDNSD